MEGWRERLHAPKQVSDLCQPAFAEALTTACNVLRPSLNERETQSSCALLIGPTSSGKTLMTKYIVEKLKNEFEEEGKELIIVTLNGLIHSTSTRAWNKISEDLMKWQNKSLQHQEEDDEKLKNIVNPILNELRQNNNKNGLLVILDEFHKFASNDPLNQTILYSLLNLLQDRSLNCACIAKTTYIDITDLLEKRIVSRLAHTKIVIPLVDNHTSLLQFFHHALIPSFSPSNNTNTPKKRGRVSNGAEGKAANKRSQSSKRRNSIIQNEDITNDLENEIKLKTTIYELLNHDKLKQIIEEYLTRNRIITPIIQVIDSSINSVLLQQQQQQQQQQNVEDIIENIKEYLNMKDTTIDIILSLTQIQLALLISLKRIETVIITRQQQQQSEDNPKKRIFFTDVYKEYSRIGKLEDSRLADVDSSQFIVDYSIASRSWESLIDYGVVIRTGTGPRDSRPIHCAVAFSQIDQAVDKYENASSVLKHWAKQSVTKC